MNTYTATFANGKTVTRKTKNEYTHAWLVTWTRVDGVQVSDSGFSASFELAQKAARPWLPVGVFKGMSANNRAIANKKNAEFLQSCNLQIEILPV